MPQTEYPEHQKLKRIAKESQKIGEFMEWLGQHGYTICQYQEPKGLLDDGAYYPTGKRLPNALLAEYFEIDEKKIEDEKRSMLDEIRKSHKD